MSLTDPDFTGTDLPEADAIARSRRMWQALEPYHAVSLGAGQQTREITADLAGPHADQFRPNDRVISGWRRRQ